MKSGCIFWMLVGLAAFVFLPGLVSIPIVAPILEAGRDRAATEKAQAQAQADLAQAGVIESQAVADTLDAYTKAGVNAIETDRRAAHPTTWLVEIVISALPWLGLCVALPCNMLAMLATLALSYKYKKGADISPRNKGEVENGENAAQA